MKREDYLRRLKIIIRSMAVILPVVAMLVLSMPVLAAPVITVFPTSGAVGTKVTITGTNYESYRGDNISVFFDNTEVANSPLIIPQSGSFSVEFNIPADASPGAHDVRVRSDAGSTLAKSSFTVSKTNVRIDTLEGVSGTTVVMSGTGFYAGRTITFYYYNRIRDKLGTEIAGPTGEFSYRFTIPVSVAGEHKVRAENAEGNSGEVNFRVIPWATINLTSGASGEILTVGGAGFGYRSDISIYFGTDEVAYSKTDEYGNFEVTFNVPEMKPGAYDVKVEDEDGNIDKARFTVTAGASLNKTEGAVGTGLTVRGMGFEAGRPVTIQYDGIYVAEAIADNDGAFSSTFNILPSIGGRHVVTVTDGTTTKQLVFTVESEPPPVPVPLLPVVGSETRSQAYLDWSDVTDASQPVIYSFQIASDQNFASIILEKEGLAKSEYTLAAEEELTAVASETPYYWRIKAVDGAANESEWSIPWSFYVAAPSVPALILPEVGIKAPAQVRFDWEDVSGTNLPVTYTLQVASDQDFRSIVLEKEGLTESEYVLTEEEELATVRKDAPYYWRVKAVHSAAVTSEWSEPSPFHVGFSLAPPGWLLYVLIGIGVLFLCFLAFWLGRRTAYYEGEP